MILPLAMQITPEQPPGTFLVDSHSALLASLPDPPIWKIKMILYDTKSARALTYEMQHMCTTSIEPAMTMRTFDIDSLSETDRSYLMAVRDRLNQLFP